jgi:hypothetical protein
MRTWPRGRRIFPLEGANYQKKKSSKDHPNDDSSKQIKKKPKK